MGFMAPRTQFSELPKQDIKKHPKYLRLFKISIVMLANNDFQDNAQFQHLRFQRHLTLRRLRSISIYRVHIWELCSSHKNIAKNIMIFQVCL